MTIPVGLAPVLRAKIYSLDGQQSIIDIGDAFVDFEWSSFINGGYNIRLKVLDTLYKRLHKIATEFYLNQSRSIPIPITFKLLWSGIETAEYATPEFTAYITKIHADGVPNSGYIEFTAIDPPSYVLNKVSSGAVYNGNISSVIEKAIKHASAVVFNKAKPDPATGKMPQILFEVSKTNDDINGTWHQMRMNTSTFIKSLIEWSSSLTKHKSQWIVASGQKEDDKNTSQPAIFIKQWAELKNNLNSDKAFLGSLAFSTTSGASDIIDFEFLGNNFTSQARLETFGISTCSGLYIDPSYSENNDYKARVDDKRTPNKLNVEIDKSRSYSKPSESELNHLANSILAVPELNGGEIGIKYQDYIDGRARGVYHKTLGCLMKIKLTTNGWYKIWDSTVLGASVVNVSWKDHDGSNYFLSGDWILYGFKHRLSRDSWNTDLYLMRIDWNAEAKKVPGRITTSS